MSSRTPPPTVQDLISKVQNSGSIKTFIVSTHMNGSEMGVAYYQTAAARDAAYVTLLAAGWGDGTEIRKDDSPGSPAPSIVLRGPGISNRIRPYLSASAMVLAVGCNSSGLESSFGSFSDPGNYTGNTFFGLNTTCLIDEGCDIVKTIIRDLGCFEFPYVGHELDDAMRFRNWTGLVSVVGNAKNSLHCYKSCWNWSANYRFVGVDAATGNAVWGVEGEDALSYYELRGYTSPGAPPDVLEAVPGFGTDGTGHLRVHSIALPGGYVEYDIVEHDDDQFISISQRFGPSDLVAPEYLVYAPGNDYDLEAISLEPEKTALPVYGGKNLETLQETMASSDPTPISFGEDDLTGDAIVFAFHPAAVWRVFQHLEAHYPTADGGPPEIVWFYTFGVPTPSQITAAVNLVRTNNQAVGGYPANPDLQIVGDGGWKTWPDVEDWSPSSGSLRGYRPIYPQGAIGVIPTLDDAEIERYLIAAEDYIAGQFVNHDAVCFVSDALNDTSAVWLQEDAQDIAGAFPAGTNVNFLYESDYASGDRTGMTAASYAAINAGVGWVFTTGFHFDVDILTHFIHAWDPLQLTTEQRNVWVNFGCRATGTYLTFEHKCKRIMFNQLDRGVGVGFFGPMMDSHGIHHRQAREVFLSEMAEATGEGGGITLAQLGRRFQDALVSAIPEYDWYADCWTYMGSIAIPYRGSPVATVSAFVEDFEDHILRSADEVSLLSCPKGDLDKLIIRVTINSSDVTLPLAAQDITISQPTSPDAVIFPDQSVIHADAAPELITPNGYRWTVTLSSLSGCGEHSVPISYKGMLVGYAHIKVRSPNLVLSPGITRSQVNITDFTDVAHGFPVYYQSSVCNCQYSKPYSPCADYVFPDTAVTMPDYAKFGEHFNHVFTSGGASPSTFGLAMSAGVVRLEFEEEQPPVGQHLVRVRVVLDGVEPFTAAVVALANENPLFRYVSWTPDPSLDGTNIGTELTRDGVKQVFLGVVTPAVSSGATTSLGIAEFVVDSANPIQLTPQDFELVTGELLSAAGGEVVPGTGGAQVLSLLTREITLTPPMYQDELAQNYPNPFNPTTTLAFSLAKGTDVELKIYDVRGALVKTLVHEHRAAGNHRVPWDGSNQQGNRVATGVYFYKLVAGSFVDTKKMTLLK
jgi:FlgD Ig-like domain